MSQSFDPAAKEPSPLVDPLTTRTDLSTLIDTLAVVGRPIEALLFVAAVWLLILALIPKLRRWLPLMMGATTVLLVAGEGVLVWFHWRLYDIAVVASPETGVITGRLAVPLWVESEKLFVWALIVGVMALFMRRHRDELLPGTAVILALLLAGSTLWGHPFTMPLPSFLGQYEGYLQATMTSNLAISFPAYQGMEGARQYYYNTWFMWVHPPLLFISYGAFVISFIATMQMVRTRFSAYETTAYRWARLGFLPLTVGMLLGFPWAILAWQGESWWWSGKVNMSIMMWFLYTAYLHGRLYLRKRGMWRWVAGLAILSFVVLILTYLTTYVVPGAHSYALVVPAGEVGLWIAMG